MTGASHPPVDPGDLLLLVFHHLRRRGMSASAVTLLRESGVDPFWLCGPSRELALLRESVFGGRFDHARALLAPLRSQLPAEQWAALLGELGKLQVLERAFKDAKSVDRRELLRQLMERARGSVETPDALRSNDPLPFLRSGDAQQCLDTILSASSETTGAVWSRHEARLQCIEALLRAFRGDIAPDEREHKYEAVAPQQLEWLVQDALLFHGGSDCVAVETRAGAAPPVSEPAVNGSDALYLSPPASERAGAWTKESRRGDRQNFVARSIDCWPVIPSLVAATAPLPVPTAAVSSQERARRWLGTSVDATSMRSLREETIPPLVSRRLNNATPHITIVGVDASTNTESPAAIEQVEAATTTRVDVEEMSTQTEAETTKDASRDPAVSQSPNAEQPTPPPVEIEDGEDDGGGEEGDSLHERSDDRLESDQDVLDEGSGLDQCPDDSVDAKDDAIDTDDEAADDCRDQPSPPLEYARLSLEHLVRARVVAEGKEAHAVRAVDVHRSGRRLAIGTNARALRLLDLSAAMATSSDSGASGSGRHLPLLPVAAEWHKLQRAPIYCVAFSRGPPSSASLVAAGDADSSIKVLRLRPTEQHAASRVDSDGAVVWSGRHAGKLRALRFSPGESGQLWSAASDDRAIRCWDVNALPSTPLLALDGHVGEVQALALTPIDSCSVLSAASDRTLRLWDARSGRCERLVASGLPHAALALEFHSQSAHAAAAGHEDGSVSLWDLRGATFASSAWCGQPQTTAALVCVARPHRDECRAVSWAPSGRWLLSGGFDGSVCFLSAGRGGGSGSPSALEPVASFTQHRDKVLQARWHPTAPAIVTTGADKSVKLWRFE